MLTTGSDVSCAQWRAVAQDACEGQLGFAEVGGSPAHAGRGLVLLTGFAAYTVEPAHDRNAPWHGGCDASLSRLWPPSPPNADEATIAQIWRVSPADVTSVCSEVAAATGRRLQQQGLPVTSLAIRHMVSIRGLAQAQAKVATSAVAIVDGSFAALVANKLRSRTLYPPRAPAGLQPACIVDVTCRPPPPPSPPTPLPAPARRRSPPPPGRRSPPPPVYKPPPAPVHKPPPPPPERVVPQPPPPARPEPSGNAALFLLGRDGCRSGGGWTRSWGGWVCMGAREHG